MNEKFEQYKEKIIQYFKRSTLSDNSIKVTRDWNYLLGVTAVAIVSFCGIGVYVFFFAQHYVEIDDSDAVLINTTFNVDEFEEILTTHKERYEVFDDIRNNKPTAPDLGVVEEVVVIVEEEDGEVEE